MTWESRLFDLFDDLEQQAEGLHRVDLDAEFAELARAGYSEVALASRFHASPAHAVEITLTGGAVVRGELGRAGRDWCLVAEAQPTGQEVLVSLPAVTAVRGLSTRAVPEAARPLSARLGLGSVLRRVAEEAERVHVVSTDGSRRQGVVQRVGADFFELSSEPGLVVVPFVGLALLRR